MVVIKLSKKANKKNKSNETKCLNQNCFEENEIDYKLITSQRSEFK